MERSGRVRGVEIELREEMKGLEAPYLVKQCFHYGMQRRIGTWFCPRSYQPYFAQSVFASSRLSLLLLYFSSRMRHEVVEFCPPTSLCHVVVASIVVAVVIAATLVVVPPFVAPPYVAAFVSLLAPPLAAPVVMVAALVVARPAVREKARLSSFSPS